MNADPVDQIARTVLYEGYLLYPYRPSAVKNRQRFTFGVLYPPRYCLEHSGDDRSQMQMQCPVHGTADTRLQITVRFLQLVEQHREGTCEPWHAGIEREVRLDADLLGDLPRGGVRTGFGFTATDSDPTTGLSRQTPNVADDSGILGEIHAEVDEVRVGTYKLTVRVANITPIGPAATRDEALVRSLASAHTVIRVVDGELVSLLDTPDAMRGVASSCVNIGVWPVLVGEEGSRDRMLASPIILYDYPQVAAESAGDLFDATEIDEILALRVLTLTEDEKREARESDERARQILDRTDALTPEHWARLHGTLRGLRLVTGMRR